MRELIAWQKARELTNRIYVITAGGSFSRDMSLVNQVRRVSVSIMSNIAEGFERSSIKDSLRFVVTAKSSCAEVRSHLYVAHDIRYLNDAEFKGLFSRANELSKIIGGLRTSLLRKLSSATSKS